MFKVLLATLALCACASMSLAGVYAPQPSAQYSSAPGYLGVPVTLPVVPAYNPAPLAADYRNIYGSNAEAASLLQLAISLPQPNGPIVGTNYPVYQRVGYGPSRAY